VPPASARTAGVGLSQRAFARQRGVTHQTVRKAIARGRIVPLPDGTIDPEAANRTWPPSAPSVKHDVPGSAAIPGFDPLALERARAAKTAIEAERAALELRRRQGELVDRALGERLVFAFGRRQRDAWLAWPARIGAELAAALGIDGAALVVQLEAYVARQLEELSGERFDLGGASVVGGAAGESAA
jgi:hypothetical protein